MVGNQELGLVQNRKLLLSLVSFNDDLQQKTDLRSDQRLKGY